MQNSKSITQITLFKLFIIVFFIFIIVNSFISDDNFLHDNAEFGIWTFISFIMISGTILTIDFCIILFSNSFLKKDSRIYINITELIIGVLVYLFLQNSFKH